MKSIFFPQQVSTNTFYAIYHPCLCSRDFFVKIRIKIFFNLKTITSQIFHDPSMASQSKYSRRLDKLKSHTVI